MHRLLSIPEIIAHIASFADKQTLARAAAVNCVWSSICLDPLWYELDSVKPLLGILPLPEHIQNDEPTVTDHGVLVAHPRWQRFCSYSHRVYDLQYNSETDPAIPRRIFTSSHPADCLFPNLKRLKWLSDSRQALQSAIVFVGQRLELLVLQLHDWYRFMTAVEFSYILEIIGSQIANVRSLKFEWFQNLGWDSVHASTVLNDTVIALLRKCRKLKDVTLPRHFEMVHIITACRLWELPELKRIGNFSITRRWSHLPVTAHDAQSCYPALTELSLWTTYDEMTKILQHASIPAEKLQYLSFINSSTSEQPLEQRQSIITLTTTMSQCRSLTHVELRFAQPEWQPGTLPLFYTIPFEFFHPLFECTKITVLKMFTPAYIAYSTGTFQTITNAWPCLQDLRLLSALIPDGTAGANHNPTFATLVQLAAGLQCLQDLELSVDFRGCSATSTSTPAPFCRLERFRVALSCCAPTNAQDIARVLGMIFPPDCALVFHSTGRHGCPWQEIDRIMAEAAGSTMVTAV